MPVVNGYAFHSAARVNQALGHVAEARLQWETAIGAFSRGAGRVGLGQAVLCWVDLSSSCLHSGDRDGARRAAERAADLARSTGDPWIEEQAAAQSAAVTGGS